MSAVQISTEAMSNYFVSYLFNEYKGSRHVRRVASWIGFIMKAVERAADSTLRQRGTRRQVEFRYKGRRFKVKYSHTSGARGGIVIVEILKGTGTPEGEEVCCVTNLAEAEELYNTLEVKLDRFRLERVPECQGQSVVSRAMTRTRRMGV